MNIKFTLYETNTGRVLCGGTTSVTEGLASEGQSLLIGKAYDNGFILDEIHHELPPKPSPHHTFNWQNKQWVADASMAWQAVRTKRLSLLAGTDWRVTKAMEQGQSLSPDWLAYRQALRDITSQSDPWFIEWPVVPQ